MERESQSVIKQSKEKKAWEKTWSKIGHGLLIHACSFGSVDSVKLLVEMGCSPSYQGYVE